MAGTPDDAERVHAELRLIADSVSIHLLHLDLSERILFANKAAADMWGMRPGQMKGRTIREIVGDEAYPSLQAFTAQVARGERVMYEAPFRRPDGTTRYFLNTYAPEFGPAGEVVGFVATGTDITERKRAEEAVRISREREQDAREALEHEHELRRDFVSLLTHDLRTPVTAAKMNAQLAMRRAEEPDHVRRLATRIVDSLSRADGMLRDLLDASRIQAGQTLGVERGDCDLGALAAEVVAELGTLHGNRFVLKVTAGARSQWDCQGVRRVLENLCSNAVKYGAPDAPITVTVEPSQDGSAMTLSVHNLGTPIPEAELGHLFEPFRRAAETHTDAPSGWGLGLTLVKGIAEAHGGSVSVQSDAASGTTFRVSLPISPQS